MKTGSWRVTSSGNVALDVHHHLHWTPVVTAWLRIEPSWNELPGSDEGTLFPEAGWLGRAELTGERQAFLCIDPTMIVTVQIDALVTNIR